MKQKPPAQPDPLRSVKVKILAELLAINFNDITVIAFEKGEAWNFANDVKKN